MSPDGNATNNQDQPQAQPHAQNASPPSSDKQQREAPPSSISSAVDDKGNGSDAVDWMGMSSETEGDSDEPEGPLASAWGGLRLIAHQLSPILVPLPFAAIIFLFSLLANAHGIANIAPLPLGIILLALAVIQSTCLFYSRASMSWNLSIVGGYALFLLVGAYVFFGFGGCLLLLAILLVLGIVFARLSTHLVPEDYVDVVIVFGRYSRTLLPGLNVIFPWEKFERLYIREFQWISSPQRVPVRQDIDVVLRAAISYQVLPENAYIPAMQVGDWQKSLHDLFISVLWRSVHDLSLEDFMALSQNLHGPPTNQGAEMRARWEQINTYLYLSMQSSVASWGVQINWARILDDVLLVPHSTEPSESTQGDTLIKPREEKTGAKSIFAQLRDAPTTEDLLSFHQYTNTIARNLANFSEGPDKNVQLSIGVYGEWGSGKTSFLQMVSQSLQGYRIQPIWFDAWKYDQEDNLWAALIQRILDQAAVNGKWYRRARVKFRIWKNSISLHKGLWEVIRKIVPVIFKIFFIGIILYILIGLDNKTIASFLSRWLPNNPVITASVQANALKVIAALSAAVAAVSGPFSLISLFKGNLGIDFSNFKEKRNYQEHIAFLDEFKQEFEKIISLLGRRKPLVVIVDDLDRCPPDKIIKVIEATKIFLDAKGCVFLFGLDRDIVERAVASKYKDIIGMDSGNSDEISRKKLVFYEEYIDKFIQLPIMLPALTQPNMNTFISRLSDDKDINACVDIFAIGLSPNPRKIKRVLQSFLFIRDMVTNDPRKSTVVTRILAKLIIIQNEQPKLFEDIVKDPSILSHLEDYYQRRKGSQSRNDSDVPVEEIDQPSHELDHELAKKYETKYPQLPDLLLKRECVSQSDSFLKVDPSQYMELMGFLGVVKPSVLQIYEDLSEPDSR